MCNEVSKAMKWIDASIETAVCASSAPFMDHFPTWEETVLQECYETVDYISMHQVSQGCIITTQAFGGWTQNNLILQKGTPRMCLRSRCNNKSSNELGLVTTFSYFTPRAFSMNCSKFTSWLYFIAASLSFSMMMSFKEIPLMLAIASK